MRYFTNIYCVIFVYTVTKDQKHVISGGSDSLLIIWKDMTEERKAQAVAEKDRLAYEEQQLANLLKAEELQAALRLALKLERPLQALRIVEGTITRVELCDVGILYIDIDDMILIKIFI